MYRISISGILAAIFLLTTCFASEMIADEASAIQVAEIDENTPPDILLPLAEKGDPRAQYHLAICYHYGKGVEQDNASTFQWLSKAAEQGHPYAQNDLGTCYRDGIGVEADILKAVEWYQKAADQGVEQAEIELQKLDPTTLLIAAVLPVFLFLALIYWMDTRKEPLWLLLVCLFYGALTCVPAALIEGLLGPSDSTAPNVQSLVYLATMVGVTEELLKFLVLYWIVWKHKEFDQYYDGIVYAVFVSLGFALLENILYVFSYGRETAVFRAALSIPLHCCCGVVMGYYFSLAKFASDNRPRMRLMQALVLPILIHAVYDFCVFYVEAAGNTPAGSVENSWAIVLSCWFMVLILYLWCAGIRRVKQLTEKDIDHLMNPGHVEKSRWYLIALHQRSLLQGIFFGIVFIPVSIFLFLVIEGFLSDSPVETRFQIYTFLFVIPYIAYVLWMFQVIYRLSESTDGSGCFTVIVWFGSSVTTPWLNIILLLWLNRKATKSLVEAGYKVGFLGANLTQFSENTNLSSIGEPGDDGQEHN